MRAFAELIDRLALIRSRNAKLAILREYLRSTPDPDRGWALAALTGELSFSAANPAVIRRVIESRLDPVLFRWSYDYVGDLAETAALAWPTDPGRRPNREPSLSEVIDALAAAKRGEVERLVEGWMDALDPRGRWAMLKLVTGALRIGLSARLARTATAMIHPDAAPVQASPEGEAAPEILPPVDVSEIEELWHGLDPPYADLFAWLEGRADRPDAEAAGRFRPVMLATAVEEADLEKLEPKAFVAEWKWDGIRVQAVLEGDARRLYSRSGDDISAAFPDVLAGLHFDGVVDGELVVSRDDVVAPFGDLQQRLNRKTTDARLQASHPAAIIAYDLLALEGEDLRSLPLVERRAALEGLLARAPQARMSASPVLDFADWDDLARLRADPPIGAAAEGVMLKRRDSAYVAGRPKGPWFKWKRDPHLIDAVLMYAQRGHGKRSSFYSDFTFGVWDDAGALSPVGKAYFGFTDEELKQLDKFVRDHTTDRFGPVRAVTATREFGLVLEIAFEGLNRSTRHKSGVAMRFPRISCIRWDKPTREADTLETVLGLLRAMEGEGGRIARP